MQFSYGATDTSGKSDMSDKDLATPPILQDAADLSAVASAKAENGWDGKRNLAGGRVGFERRAEGMAGRFRFRHGHDIGDSIMLLPPNPL